MRAYIVLCLLVGVRTEEARALRWDHVDLDGRADADPAVPPSVAVWRSVRAHGDTKTGRSRRTLGLPRMAVDALRDHRESQRCDRAAAGDLWQEHGLVFATQIGTRWMRATSGGCSRTSAGRRASEPTGLRGSCGRLLSHS
ncbi:MAG TPA: hypothetical protein VEF71_13090 [Streptosporangiaceae bacterium]|nr:hypothetical protein [Streptosporangiaceae bacterium]